MIIEKILSHYYKNNNSTHLVLDVGAGYGGMYHLLKKYGLAHAYEVEISAASECKKRGYREVITTQEEFEKNDKQFNLIGAFDVIEHTENDAEFVSLLFEKTKQGGMIVVTVPAYQWMWSQHDIDHHHFRRYTKREITILLEQAGFTIIYSSYWNTILFIPAAIVRLFGFGGGGALTLPRIVNQLLAWLIKIEFLFLPFVSFPFGISIIVCAAKR